MVQLPDRINRLDELAYDFWWSWTTEARQVFRTLDYPLWRQTAHNPVRMLQLIPPRHARRGRARSGLAGQLRSRDRPPRRRALPHGTPGSRRMPGTERTSRSPTSPPSSRCTSRCRSTPAASACWPATTARRPATSACRSSASGFMYPQGYFHQGLSPDGWQQENYEKLNWTETPHRAGASPPRASRRHRGAARQPHGARRRLARARRPREAVPARHRPRGERAVGSRAVGAPVWRRPRNARAAGDHPRHRRRPRAQGDRPSTRRSITSTKATPPSSSLQRIRDLCEQGWTFDAALEEVRRTTVFTTHTPVAAGPRRVPVPAGRNAPGRRVGRSGRLSREVPGARPLRQRRRTDVQHDGAGAAHERRRQRRQPAARRSHASRCGGRSGRTGRPTSCRSRSSPTACTCRRGCRRRSSALLEKPSGRRLARRVTTIRPSPIAC